MNIPHWQYITLCIFGLLNLSITALAIHMQTYDTRILFIVLACHRTLAPSINNHYKPLFTLWKCRMIQITIKAQTHTFMPCLGFFQAVVTLQKNARHLFYLRLNNCLPSHCHIFSLCSFSSFWHAWDTFICLCGMVESQSTWSTKDAMRTVPGYFHHRLSKTLKTFYCSLKCTVRQIHYCERDTSWQ